MGEDSSTSSGQVPLQEEALGLVQEVVSELPAAILLVSSEGRVFLWNTGAERLYGFQASEAHGRPLEDLIVDTEERPALRQVLERVLKEGTWQGLCWRRTRAGARLRIESRLHRLTGPNMLRPAVLLCDRPSEGLLLLREGPTSESFARSILEAAPDATAVVSADGSIAFANGELLRLFGYERDELLGQPVELLVPEALRQAHVLHRRDYLREPRARPMGNGLELYGRRKDGAAFPAEISLAPLRTAGSGLLVIASVRDISQRLRAEETLLRERVTRLQAEQAERQAAIAVQQRDEFLTLAAHELKTPLTSLRLVAQTLLRFSTAQDETGALPPWIRSRLEILDRQVDRMSRLVGELLEVSRISTRRLVLDPETLDLGELLHEVGSHFEDAYRMAHTPLAIKAAGNLTGSWDRLRLEQVLTNLLDNALKYGIGQPVQAEATDLGERVQVNVRDGGVGIAPADQARIFQRFERATQSHSPSGFGLGLWISREIVAAHGGTIRVESKLGHGSLFVVELPRAIPPSSSTGPGPAR